MLVNGFMVVDESELKKFIDSLPEIDPRENAYLLMLMARTRYIKERLGIKVPERQTVFERKIITGENWREKLVRTVKRLALLGYYSDQLYVVSKEDKLYAVPQFSTSIVIEMNPARVKKALISLWEDTLRLAIFEDAWHLIAKLDKRWFSMLHSSTSKKIKTLDIDTKDEDLVDLIRDKLLNYSKDGKVPYLLIETKRGYHFVVDLSRMKKEFFRDFIQKELPNIQQKYIIYVERRKEPALELKQRALEPIPGTLHADFRVRLLEVWGE